ncbi:hypothetical protein V5799_013852, partial [Amblyomma americanum]
QPYRIPFLALQVLQGCVFPLLWTHDDLVTLFSSLELDDNVRAVFVLRCYPVACNITALFNSQEIPCLKRAGVSTHLFLSQCLPSHCFLRLP